VLRRTVVLQKSEPLTDSEKSPPEDILLPRKGVIMNSPIKTKVKTIDGLSIRYAESDPRETTAILLSPWPESLFTFEQMWSRLAAHAQLVAIDLPGFGHSERRNELLTPSAMGEFIAHLIEDFGLKQPHAVGPDIGTSALLFAAAKHPDLLRSIVIGNGTAAVPLQVASVLKDVIFAPSLEPFQSIDPRKGVESVLQYVERYKLPEHVREDFLSSYEGDRFAESLRFVRSYPTELPVLSKLLPSIKTPVQIITGDHDPGVLPVNGDFLHESLPRSKHDKVNAGHFAWADAADDYAKIIIEWWNGGYERVKSKMTPALNIVAEK
jgi:pimeloyl-ACP methyl ester carboxylesterase